MLPPYNIKCLNFNWHKGPILNASIEHCGMTFAPVTVIVWVPEATNILSLERLQLSGTLSPEYPRAAEEKIKHLIVESYVTKVWQIFNVSFITKFVPQRARSSSSRCKEQ
jgi:hypothetical protein